MWVLGLADNMRGPLFPDLLQEYHLANSEGSLFFALASAMTIPGGYLAGIGLKYLSGRTSLQISLGLMIASLLGFWASPTFTAILVSAFFYGLSIGMMGVVQNVMVIESVPPDKIHKYQSGLHSAYGFASLLAPILVGVALSASGNWKLPFLFAALLSLVVWLATFADRSMATKALHVPSNQVAKKLKAEVYFFAVLMACYVALELMVSTRIAQFARFSQGWTAEAANNLTTLYFFGMFAGRLVFFFFQPKKKLGHQLLISLSAGLVLVGAGVWVHPIFLALTGFAVAPFYPMCMTAGGKLFPGNVSSAASKAIALTGVTVVLMQTAVGVVSDHLNLSFGMMVGPAFGLCTLVMILTYKRFFGREFP